MDKKERDNEVKINYDLLRKQAEARLKENDFPSPAFRISQDKERLIEELRIHQVELEMQNDELRQTQAELFAEREKYADLYNFAPVAYFLFDENDIILDLNYAASQLLGKERIYLINRPFTVFLPPDSLETFFQHREYVRRSGNPQSCELIIGKEDEEKIHVHVRTIALKDEKRGRHIWRSVMSDISELKRTAAELERSQSLILALSHGAQSVLLAASREEIYRAVGKQIEQLDSSLVIFNIVKEHELEFAYTTLSTETLRNFEIEFGYKFEELSLPVLKDGLIETMIRNKKAVFLENTPHFLAAHLPHKIIARSLSIVQFLKVKELIVAPLDLEGETLGVLMVIGPSLRKTDVVAIDVFSSQIAISLHNAKLNEKLGEALKQQRELAQIDFLTGVYNRRAFTGFAEEGIKIAQRYARKISMIMIDLDRFKSVNDRFGHDVGDEMLKHVTSVIRSALRDADVLGRYGGEEFIIFLPETDSEEAEQIAERLRQNIAESRLLHKGEEISVTASFGVITYSPDVKDFEDFMKKVDQVLYAAKRAGRNRLLVYGKSDEI